MSLDCDKTELNEPEENQGASTSVPNDVSQDCYKAESNEPEGNQGTSAPVRDVANEEMEITQKEETEQVQNLKENMVYEDGIQGQKRPLSTDSEANVETPQRRQRYKPVPILELARATSKSSSKNQPANSNT